MTEDQEPRADAEARLVLLTGDARGTAFPIEAEETLIGRSPANDITLDDDGASREHAMLMRDADAAEVVVEDLQSTNGTKVNGKRVRSAVLAPGDELQIGHTRFAFSVGAANDDEVGS